MRRWIFSEPPIISWVSGTKRSTRPKFMRLDRIWRPKWVYISYSTRRAKSSIAENSWYCGKRLRQAGKCSGIPSAVTDLTNAFESDRNPESYQHGQEQ